MQLFRTLRHKLGWHLNQWMLARLWLVNLAGGRLTVVDVFGSPGDTLLTSTVCRELKQCYPRLRINCVTPNPSVLEADPHLSTLNAPETFFRLPFSYLDLVARKDTTTNILEPTFRLLGLQRFAYKARVYLRPEERQAAAERLADCRRPIISVNLMSRELVKVWPPEHWRVLLERLRERATIVQVGDDREPHIDGVVRLAGRLSLRESMAVLSHATVHVGPDSFLMHAANGLDVKSVIIFGGSRLPASLGYAGNINLETRIECSGCWIHTSHGQTCPYEVKCMTLITPDAVFAAVDRLLNEIAPASDPAVVRVTEPVDTSCP